MIKMLMAVIFTWDKDMVIQFARSMEWAKEMKRRFGPETEVILYGNLLFPIKFDNAVRQLDEEEIVEWMHTEVYPALVEEGKMIRKNGKYVKAPQAGLLA
jgi:hypothetical protein